MPEAWGTVVIKSTLDIDNNLAKRSNFDAAIQNLSSFAGIDMDDVKALELNFEKS